MNYLKNRLSAPSTRILLAVFVYFLIFHLAMTHPARDDFFFGRVLDNIHSFNDLWNYAADRYLHWGSRTQAETLLIFISHWPFIIWQVLDSLIFTGTVYLFAKISWRLCHKASYNLQLAAAALIFVVLYPILDMKTAGWITTTVNYLWPAFCLLCMVLYAIRLVQGEKQSRSETAWFIFCVFFSASLELIAAAGVALLCFMLIVCWRKGVRPRALIPGLVLSLACFAYAMLCPGSAIRYAYAVSAEFPSWESLNVIEHLTIALAATFSRLSSFDYAATGVQAMLLYALFNFLVLCCIHRRYRSLVLDLLFALPFVFFYLMNQCDMSYVNITAYMEGIASVHAGEFRYAFQPMLSILFIGWNLLGLMLCFRPEAGGMFSAQVLTVLFLYLVTLGSRIAMGLSSSVYSSNTRTFILQLFGLILLSLLLLSKAHFYEWAAATFSTERRLKD